MGYRGPAKEEQIASIKFRLSEKQNFILRISTLIHENLWEIALHNLFWTKSKMFGTTFFFLRQVGMVKKTSHYRPFNMQDINPKH